MYLNNYQSFIFGAIIIGLLSFVACEKTVETKKIIGFGVKAELAQTKSIWFGADTLTGVKVSVSEIADSRCPEDLICVWAGEAKVKLLAVNKKDSLAIQLSLSAPKDSLNFSLGDKNYKAILSDVNPYPNSTKNQGVKFATFTILNKN